MLIEEVLGAVLQAHAPLTDLIGVNVHAVTIPQEKGSETDHYPAVVYSLAERERGDTHDGPERLVKSIFEIFCLAKAYGEAKRVAQAAVGALHGKQEVFNQIYESRAVRRVICDTETDDYVYDPVEKLALYTVSQRYLIHHKEDL